MSTHVLTASGQRGLNLAINATESTGASIPAKPGDSVAFQGNSFDRARIILPPEAEIRRYQVPWERDKEKGWDEYIEIVVERKGGAGANVRFEIDDRPEGEYLPTPHTTMFVRRELDPAYWESQAKDKGKIVEAGTIGDLLGPIEQ